MPGSGRALGKLQAGSLRRQVRGERAWWPVRDCPWCAALERARAWRALAGRRARDAGGGCRRIDQRPVAQRHRQGDEAGPWCSHRRPSGCDEDRRGSLRRHGPGDDPGAGPRHLPGHPRHFDDPEGTRAREPRPDPAPERHRPARPARLRRLPVRPGRVGRARDDRRARRPDRERRPLRLDHRALRGGALPRLRRHRAHQLRTGRARDVRWHRGVLLQLTWRWARHHPRRRHRFAADAAARCR